MFFTPKSFFNLMLVKFVCLKKKYLNWYEIFPFFSVTSRNFKATILLLLLIHDTSFLEYFSTYSTKFLRKKFKMHKRIVLCKMKYLRKQNVSFDCISSRGGKNETLSSFYFLRRHYELFSIFKKIPQYFFYFGKGSASTALRNFSNNFTTKRAKF